jgi:hypothetical protein
MKKIKIIGLKTFKKFPGFTFEYPIFKGWEVSLIKKINNNVYEIILNYGCPKNNFAFAIPKIIITKYNNLGLKLLRGKDITYSNIINGDVPSDKAKKIHKKFYMIFTFIVANMLEVITGNQNQENLII